MDFGFGKSKNQLRQDNIDSIVKSIDLLTKLAINAQNQSILCITNNDRLRVIDLTTQAIKEGLLSDQYLSVLNTEQLKKYRLAFDRLTIVINNSYYNIAIGIDCHINKGF